MRLASGKDTLAEQVERTLKGTAAQVADYLRRQGLSVRVKTVHQEDQSQGYFWTEIFLTASW